MSLETERVVFDSVSKFYGEILGVNRVSFSLEPGITALVGPNGAGKTTLMNLMTGLIQPTDGRVSVRGLEPSDPEAFFRMVGYCTQFDSFPRGATGNEFLREPLRLAGYSKGEAGRMADEALDRVGMQEAAGRRVAGYSKGMRQRVRLAQALAHRPSVLVLDEPLNGLDPMARAESLALFEELGRQGLHLIVSSHILEEVDRIADRVVLMSSGFVVAEGRIDAIRREVRDQPMQILVRCTNAKRLAAEAFALDRIAEAKLQRDGGGVLVRTGEPEQFYRLLNRVASEGWIEIEAVAPADSDVNSIYQYLIGADEGLS